LNSRPLRGYPYCYNVTSLIRELVNSCLRLLLPHILACRTIPWAIRVLRLLFSTSSRIHEFTKCRCSVITHVAATWQVGRGGRPRPHRTYEARQPAPDTRDGLSAADAKHRERHAFAVCQGPAARAKEKGRSGVRPRTAFVPWLRSGDQPARRASWLSMAKLHGGTTGTKRFR